MNSSYDDNRDLRDPEALGLVLLHTKRADAPTMSMRYDVLERSGLLNIAMYEDQPTDHAGLRKAELQERAETGDKFAAAVLNGDYLGEDSRD